MSVRVVSEDELRYARERVVHWLSKPYPHMTLGQVQSIAILIAVERQKAVAEAEPPRRERRVCMPITLPQPQPQQVVADDDEPTEPTTNPGKRK